MIIPNAHGNNGSQMVALTGATSLMVAFTVGSSSKSSWTQITSSCPFDVGAFQIFLQGRSATIARSPVYIDLGIGSAGSEQVIIQDYMFMHNYVTTTANGAGFDFSNCLWPLSITRGQRIAVRGQTSSASPSMNIGLLLFPRHQAIMPPCQKAVRYPSTAVTYANINQPGSTHTKGSWTEIVASTTHPIKYLIPCRTGASSPIASTGYIDIGIGAAGSETVIIPDYFNSGFSGGTAYTGMIHPQGAFAMPFPVNIPAGVRIAARQQASTTNNDGVIELYLCIFGLI